MRSISNHIHRWVLVIVLLALVGLSVIACGGAQPGPGGGTPGTTPAATSTSGY